MNRLWLVGLVPLLIVGCAKKEAEDTGKAPSAPKASGQADGGGPIAMAGEKPTFVAVTEIFNKRCTNCHGNGKNAGGYDMTSYDAVIKGGRNGKAVVAGDENSPLVQYLTGEKTPRMPKKGPALHPDDIALIKAWIKAGAKNE